MEPQILVNFTVVGRPEISTSGWNIRVPHVGEHVKFDDEKFHVVEVMYVFTRDKDDPDDQILNCYEVVVV